MIIGKSKKEIEKMRAAGQLVGHVLQELRWMVEPGITTFEVDRAAERMIRDAGALPTFKGYHGFPYSICASVNEQVVHGFPSDYELKEGDIFSIDVGVTLEGFVGDTATTVPVGDVSPESLNLIRITEECLARAIEQCRAGLHLGDIGWAVQEHAESHGYSVVRDYVGHGIGRRMHEGWTVVTLDGRPSAHTEHTIAITENGPEVLTQVTPRVSQQEEAALCN